MRYKRYTLFHYPRPQHNLVLYTNKFLFYFDISSKQESFHTFNNFNTIKLNVYHNNLAVFEII